MEDKGTSGQATRRNTGDNRSMPIMVVSAMLAAGRQETSREVHWDDRDGREEPVTLLLSGESPSIHDTSSHFLAWPGPSMGQTNTQDMAMLFSACPWAGRSLTSTAGL